MDDVKAVIEQATDAMGTPPEAPAEEPKPEMKKVRRAAKKVARKVGPKSKVGKKAKKSAKKSPKKAPKKAKAKKRRQRKRSAEVKPKPFRLLEGETASRRGDLLRPTISTVDPDQASGPGDLGSALSA